jgi:hypothetical protein
MRANSRRVIRRFRLGTGRNAFVAVVTNVGGDEVVARHGVVGQISRQLIVRPDVRNTVGRVWIRRVAGHVVEVYEREMFDIEKGEIDGADIEDGTAKVRLRVGHPGNAIVLKKPH